MPEEAEELEGCTSALAGEEAETEPVEALDHVMANVQGNTQSAPGSEEDILLTVAALTIGVAFSDTNADIDVLYSHVAATLHIDVSRAMQKVDARAADIDQLQSRTYPVDPVEYLWPGARESVESLVTNLSPLLAAANEAFEEVEVEVDEPPVPPQDIVGGQQLAQAPATPPKPEPAAKRAASAPEAKPHRRGSRAGRYRQERWAKKDWRTQVELVQEFIWTYLGHVRIHYNSWWDTPESAREIIDGFYLRGAQENAEEAFWEGDPSHQGRVPVLRIPWRPRLTGQPELDEAEALLFDNAVLEYLRTQYTIQVDSSLKASSLDWERETRGRQVHPSAHNPRGLRSRSIGAEGDRSRTPAGPPREGADSSRVSLLSRPTILRPATPGSPTIRIDGEGWWQKIAEREATEVRSGKGRGPAPGTPAYTPTAEQAHPEDPWPQGFS